jgi:putative membrane protein
MNGLATLISELRTGPPVAGLVRFGILFVLLFSVELVGLRTGFPFGDYFYTDTLRFALIGVPIAIPFAWYGTVVNTWRISEIAVGRGAGRFPWRIAVMAGLLTVALDLVLEPMASVTNRYWLWSGTAEPWQNYAAWFVLGAGAVAWSVSSAHELGDTDEAVRGRRATGVLLFGMQWTLFALTDLVHGQIGAVILSIVFLALARVVGGRQTEGLRRALWGHE